MNAPGAGSASCWLVQQRHTPALKLGIRRLLSQQSAGCSLLGVGHQLAHRVARHLDALPPYVKPHCRAGGWAREENRAWQTQGMSGSMKA